VHRATIAVDMVVECCVSRSATKKVPLNGDAHKKAIKSGNAKVLHAS
jgi:hypothetical protein